MPVVETSPSPLSRLVPVVTATVHAASSLRGERVIHARGRTVRGRLRISGRATYGAVLLDRPGEYDVLVRHSRSVGLPSLLPDVHGLAIRVPDVYGPDRHQDLLLDSTLAPPLLRRWPLPGWRPTLYGSLLGYEIGGVQRLLGARWQGEELELLVASVHGPWTPVGRLTLGEELPAPEGRQLRFNVGNTGGGITLAGRLQALRARSYEASRVGPDA